MQINLFSKSRFITKSFYSASLNITKSSYSWDVFDLKNINKKT